MTVDDEYTLNDPTSESHILDKLQPDTRYTVCIHITRDWYATPIPITSAAAHHPLNSSLTRPDRLQSGSTGSSLRSRIGETSFPEPIRTVTERECRVAVTSWFHWPALISSLVGILIAILISFSIFVFLKRAQARLKKARRDQKKAYCTDHAHPMLAKHPDSSPSLMVVAPNQTHSLKCPHHRCLHCSMHSPHSFASKSPTTSNSTASPTVSLSQPHHHHHHHHFHHPHHHHHHHHRHHTHRHPVPPRTHPPSMVPLTDTDGEQASPTDPLSPATGDLLSIDMAQSLSGSDSYQFSSTSSADDRVSICKPQQALSGSQQKHTLTTTTTTTAGVINSLSPNEPFLGPERKRTVSFLLSERKKSITEKLRSKSIDKTILDGWPTRKLPFGFRKSKKSAGRHSVAEGLINIPQVTVTLPDVSDAPVLSVTTETTVPVKTTPTSSGTPVPIPAQQVAQKQVSVTPTDSDKKPSCAEQSSNQPTAFEPSLQPSTNSKPTTPPQKANNVLSPTLPDRDVVSVSSSVLGSDRDMNEARPAVIPAALSVTGFKVAVDASPDPVRWTNVITTDHPLPTAAPITSSSSSAASSSSSGGRSTVSPVPCDCNRKADVTSDDVMNEDFRMESQSVLSLTTMLPTLAICDIVFRSFVIHLSRGPYLMTFIG
ncbi:unnamed protein product [Echinostoma caproni]|uniref:Uncharacterized protein n=1 Tax=Echinostoma caproni TaxID=27848 RepID=A0A3P8J4V6_9TREM|nr:unnamed protein product [Echinostoma caproni]